MTDRQKKLVWLLAVAVFILFCGLVGRYIGVPMVQLAEDPQKFRDWVDSYGIWSRAIFVCMVVIQVLVAFIPGEPIELAAGYTFGVLEGTLLTMSGFLIGSWMIFLLVRKFGVKLVEVFFPEKKISELGFLKNPKKTALVAFTLMMIPGTPKDFLSYFAGLTSLSLKQWLLIVAVARIPSLLTSTIAGAAAGEENYPLTAGMLILTLLVSLIGIRYYRVLTRRENRSAEK